MRPLSRAPNWPLFCSSNSTKRIACWLRSVQDSPLLRSACLTAECAWTRFQKNRSHASIPAGTRSAGNAFVRSSCRRSSRAASQFCAQRAPRIGEPAQRRQEVSPIVGTCHHDFLIDVIHRRGVARPGARHRHHRRTIRDVGRNGDVRILCSPALPQVSEQCEGFRSYASCHLIGAPTPVSSVKRR